MCRKSLDRKSPQRQSQANRVDQFSARRTQFAYQWAWQKVFVGKSRILLSVLGLGCLLQSASLGWHILIALLAHTGWHGVVQWFSTYKSTVDVHRYTLSSLVTITAVWLAAGIILMAVSFGEGWRRRASKTSAL